MKKLLFKTYSVIFIQGFSQGSTLAIRLLSTRLLTVSDFGILSMVIMFANFAAQIMGFGTGKLITKEISIHRNKDEHYLKLQLSLWSLLIIFCLAIVLAILCFLGRFQLSEWLSIPVDYLHWIIPLGFSLAIYEWHSSIYNGFGKVANGRVVQFLLMPALIIVFLGYCYLESSVDLVQITCGHAVIYLFSAGVGVFFSLKIVKIAEVVKIQRYADTRGWLKFSSLNFFSLFLQNILSRLDLLFIGFFLTTREFGLYTVAAGIFMTVSFINYAFSLNLEPKISYFHDSGQISKLLPFLKRNILIQTILVGLTYAGIIALGQWMLGLFGKEYTEMQVILCVLCLTLFSQSLTGPASVLLVMTNHLKERIIATLISVLIGCLIYPLAIKYFGLIGVAAGHFVTNFVCRLLLVYYVSKTLKINLLFSRSGS